MTSTTADLLLQRGGRTGWSDEMTNESEPDVWTSVHILQIFQEVYGEILFVLLDKEFLYSEIFTDGR